MSRADYVWKVEDHVCAACFGRVLSRLEPTKPTPRRAKEAGPANGLLGVVEEVEAEQADLVATREPPETVMRRSFRCSNCGAAWSGLPAGGCACGLKVGTRNAGVRCVVNPDRRPELPSEIIAQEVE